MLAPSRAGDADVRRWWTRTARRGAGPAVAAAIWDLALSPDVRSTLPILATPTLVIVTVDNRFIYPEFGKWMADHIPGAELCRIQAADHLLWAVPDDIVVDEIERHLTGSMTSGSHARTMAAIIFTDIVGSTVQNTARGDRAWLELLARHDDHAGVHVSEVAEVGDDILGLGVTIAVRALGEASGGEVVTTRAVADTVAGSKRQFESRGGFDLKGESGEWELLTAIHS